MHEKNNTKKIRKTAKPSADADAAERSVLILTQHFPPELIGGVETRFEAMANAAAEDGCQVLVVVTNGPQVTNTVSNRVKIRWMGWNMDVTYNSTALDRMLARALSDVDPPSVAWVANPSLVNSLKRVFPNIPVVLMPGQVDSLTWRSCLKRMFIVGRRNGVRYAVRSFFRDLAFRKAIRSSELVAVPCPHQLKSLCSEIAWAADKTRVLPRGICVRRWRVSRRTREVSSFNPLKLLVACRLDPVKNLELAILAMARVASQHIDVQLRIVGTGTEEASLRQLVSSLSLERSVEFMPMTHDMPSHYLWADAFVMSSNNELFGNTVLESLAAGCPVLLRRNDPPHVVIGCWEQLKECPSVIPFSTYGETGLAKAIASLATERHKLERLSRQAELCSENLDWRHFVKEYTSVRSLK